MVFWGENKVRRKLTFGEVYDQVSQLAQALRAMGVKAGDRVAAFMPNMPEAPIGMLAASSIGAIWSSCSPDFGVQGVLDRFGQIEPKVLLCVDGYYYGGKTIETLGRIEEIVRQLPSLEKVVVVPYISEQPRLAVDPQRGAAGRVRSALPSRATSPSSACPSTIRWPSSTRPAPPGFRSASCTARAARCCSI